MVSLPLSLEGRVLSPYDGQSRTGQSERRRLHGVQSGRPIRYLMAQLYAPEIDGITDQSCLRFVIPSCFRLQQGGARSVSQKAKHSADRASLGPILMKRDFPDVLAERNQSLSARGVKRSPLGIIIWETSVSRRGSVDV